MKIPEDNLERKFYDHTILPFPRDRFTIIDGLEVGSRRHVSHILVEIDVTKPRTIIREYKERSGTTLSFTAFIIMCIGKATDEHRLLHAYRDWRGRYILFDLVDVATLIEPQEGKVAIPHIIRAVNKKPLRKIHDEIRAVQANPEKSIQKSGLLMKLSPFVPSFVRRLFMKALMRNPFWFKKNAGTIVVTSVGMFGKGGGWGFGIMPFHTLGFAVGGIARKPGVFQNSIEIREYLDLTVSFDHDIVDGAPVVRFIKRLVELIEGGYGLSEELK
jgi:pyruvate/2-oxoglutarate dehydrogenase complex dihydrolipoamide acyltransferase (E2) component